MTAEGARQCEELGKALRRRYGEALRVESVRATNIRRTQQSAQNVLLGLLTPDARVQPMVPVSVRDWPRETLVPNTIACPPLRALLRAAARPSTTPLREHIAAALGYDESARDGRGFRIDQAREVLMCLQAHEAHAGGSDVAGLPPGVSIEDVEALLELNYAEWQAKWGSTLEMQRLAIGALLGEIRQAMAKVTRRLTASVDAAEDEDDGIELHLFAGHDLTIVPLLFALGARDGSFPRYASHLVIEVATRIDSARIRAAGEKSTHADHAFVRVLYDGRPLRLTAHGFSGSAWLPWRAWLAMLEPTALTPAEYRAICAWDIESDFSDQPPRVDESLEDTLTGAGRRSTLNLAPPASKL